MTDMWDEAADRMAAKQPEREGNVARGVVSLVATGNPDADAILQRAARRTGVPIDSARQNPKLAESTARIEAVDWTGMATNSPRTTRFLSEPNNAAIAHDDVGVLAKLEDAARSGGDMIRNNAKAFFKSGLLSASANVVSGALSLFETPVDDEMRKKLGRARPITEFLTQYRDSIQRSADAARPRADTRYGQAWYSGVESMPSSLMAGGMALLGSPEAGLAFMGSNTYGQAYAQGRKEGLSPYKSQLFGVTQGSLEALTEMAPEFKLFENLQAGAPLTKTLVDALVREVPGEQVATITQDFTEWATLPSNADKTFGDYLRDRPSAAVDTLIATASGTTGNIALTKAIERAGKAAAPVVRKLTGQQVEAQHAQAVAEHLANLGKLVSTSKLRERDTTSFQSFLTDATEGTDIEDIYIAPQQLGEVLNQSGLDEEQQKAVADAIGPRIAEAVQQGTDVRIPTSEFATLLAGTPAEKQLLEHAKVDPNGMTKAEAEEWMQTTGDQLRQEIDQAVQRATQDEEQAGHFEAVKSGILEQLNSARRFTPAVNESYATTVASMYATMAQRMNTTASELWQRFPLRVQAQGVTGERLDQNGDQTQTPEFKNWFGDSKVTDAEGKPLVVYHGTTSDFTEFKAQRTGKASALGMSYDVERHGIFVTPDPALAEEFTRSAGSSKPGANIIPAYISMKNPFDMRDDAISTLLGTPEGDAFEAKTGLSLSGLYNMYETDRWEEFDGEYAADFIGRLKDAGYDGAILKEPAEQGGVQNGVSYVVFDPTQIKSAIGNNGQFDPNDPNILHQSGTPEWMHSIDKAMSGERTIGFLRVGGTPAVLQQAGLPAQSLEIGRQKIAAINAGHNDHIVPAEVFYNLGALIADPLAVWPSTDPNKPGAVVVALDARDDKGNPILAAVGVEQGRNVVYSVYGKDPKRGKSGDDLVAEMIAAAKRRGQQVFEKSAGGDVMQGQTPAISPARQRKPMLSLKGKVNPDDNLFQSDQVFYSALERAVEATKTTRASGEQWLATLSKTPGVKKEELEWTGLPEWLASQDGAISRDEVLAFVHEGGVQVEEVVLGEVDEAKVEELADQLRYEWIDERLHEEGGSTKFESYTEDGGEDYRELLLTLPPGVRGNPDKAYYHSGHFNDQPVIAHVRFKARKSADGKDVLFVEEVQSDWHQQGREKGYAAPADRTKVAEAQAAYDKADEAFLLARRAYRDAIKAERPDDELNALSAESDKAREALDAASQALSIAKGDTGIIPDAPFKNTPAWAGLAMKRVIRWAADNGFDQVAWTTGEQQAERYGLHQVVSEIKIARLPDGRYQVHTPSNSNVISMLEQNNLGEYAPDGSIFTGGLVMTGAQVKQAFGNDVGGRAVTLADDAAPPAEAVAEVKRLEKAEADALMADLTSGETLPPGGTYEAISRELRKAKDALGGTVTMQGEDLKLGGEGMKAFYDRMLPNITKDIIKKHGSSVRPIAVKDFVPEPVYADLEANARATERALALAAQEAGYRILPDAQGVRANIREFEQNGASEGKLFALRNVLAKAEAREEARLALQRAKVNTEAAPTNLGFDITPELKAAANQGFALFQKERGAYSPATDTITLLKSADLSTFLHESGHFFLEMLHRLATDPAAPQQIKDDWTAALKWFGVSEADWQGYTLEQKRASHEKWARGFEAYLFTGKAPSMRLQSIFGRFRAWLISVYKQARNLGVQPTPEIRGVFDRMLATDEEIAQAEAARSMLPLFENREASGMDPLQWADYQRQAQDATDEAISDLQSRSLRDMQWLTNAKGREIAKLKRKAAATRKAVRKQVAAEVMAEPVYRSRLFLTKGLLDGEKVDGPHRLSIPEVDALYGDTPALKTIKDALGYGAYGMLSAENGLHPEQVAELFGFTSADHLIREVMAAEDMNAKIEALTDKQMLEDHGELVDEQAIEDAANRAIHSEARAKFVATELAALDKATGKTKVLAKAAKQFAEETVARLKVRDLRPALYEAAAARAGKAAQAALARGETRTAAAEKRNQLINIHAAKAALRAKEEIEKALDYFSKVGTSQTIDPEYRQQIETLLASVELRRGRSLRSIDSAISLAEWIEKQRDMGLEPVVTPEMAQALSAKKSYKLLTVEELRGLVDAVKNIEHLGRLKNRLLTAKKDRDFQAAVADAVETIQTNAVSTRNLKLEPDGSVKEKVHKGILDFLALHRKFASVIRQMDGFRDGGALWELFVRPMNAAGDKEASMRADATKRLAEILKPILGKQMSKKVYIPEIGASLSLQGRIAIALNMGNSINRERVMMGDNWTQDQLQAVLSTLTAEHWQTVQKVWDYINSYWPQIAAKETRVSGVAPEKVEAEPFSIVTADGQTLDLAGGYYPIKYDADRSTKAEADTAAEIAQQFTRGLYSRASTRRGHTKARVETVKRPVRKDLGVVVQHLTEVIHDLAWHEYLIDATRLLRAAPIDAAIREHYGPETLRAFRNALTDMAAGDVPAANVFERSVNYLRTGATVAGMGWSFSTALLQPLGLSQSMKRIGVKWVARGMGRWLKDAATMQNTVAWISAQSEFMRTRALTQQREISEIQNKVADKESLLADSFFYMIQKLQMIADVPTWIGQYEKSIASGESHARAVALADQAVLDAQGGGQIKDLAGIQRGGPLMKLWTNFYSYFSTTYNLVAESVGEARLTGGYGRMAVDLMLLTIIPATLAYLIRHALKGDVPDEPEELAKALAKENASYLFGMIVGLRDLEAAAIEGDESPAGAAFLGNLARFGKQVQQMELDEALVKSTNQAAGVLFHYPAAQVQRTALGFEAIAEGRTYNPMALLLGPPQEAR